MPPGSELAYPDSLLFLDKTPGLYCYLFVFTYIYRVSPPKIREEDRMSAITHKIGNTCAFCGVAVIAAVAIITLATLIWVALL